MTHELIQGLEEFKRDEYQGADAVMPTLAAEGQDPRYFIISCIDSRCNPGTIFRAKPGTFFAHKAMGAIVRPYQKGTALAAALHFAIEYNNVTKVIVLGHTQCGAVKALVEDIDDEEISSFIEVAKHGHDKAVACCSSHDEIIEMTEQEVVLESAENLKTYPSVKKALAEGRVEIKAWQFDIKTGDLLEHDEGEDGFHIVTTTQETEDSRKNA